MSAIEETKREISVPSVPKQTAGRSAGAAAKTPPGGVTMLERGVTLAVCLGLTIVIRLMAGEAMSNFTLAGMLAVSAAVTALGVQRSVEYLSSVRVGVVLLVLLAVASMIGMLIMQVNVDGFEKYYAALTPAQKMLYYYLGFFDIYHSRYFNFLLLLLSLNIVLASIDRFPKAWTFISRPKLDASAHWLKGQEQHAELEMPGASREEVAARVAAAYKQAKLKTRVTEKGTRTFVFGESGVWNRLGAYAVHVALLTIFLGGLLTAQRGRTGEMPLKPGSSANMMSETVFKIDPQTQEFAPVRDPIDLPFDVYCTDIQQKLIRKEGAITADNTLDWLTWIKIKDRETGTEHEGLVHLNHPFDYRGYRFFQASFQAHGQARHITLKLTPERGGEPQIVTIKRDGDARLPDGTQIAFIGFFPDFTLAGNSPGSASDEYNNPAALLRVTPASGAQPERAFAFTTQLPEGMPVGAAKGGYKFQLVDFEKVPNVHILSIQRDPGSTIVYIGFALLALTLAAVFFFAHKRIWAVVEEKEAGTGVVVSVVMGGNINRNHQGFEDSFKRLVASIEGGVK